MSSARVLAHQAFSDPLVQEVPAGRQVLVGSPEARLRVLAELSGVALGLWEITEGTVEDIEQDEVFLVLSGSATVTFDDGETVELRTGSCVRLAAGERTTWEVRETLRKLYVIP